MKQNVWIKSTRSGNNGQCVEARNRSTAVDVRDSKHPDGPVLTFSPEAWAGFIRGVTDGTFEQGWSLTT